MNPASSALVSAAGWIEAALLGSIATTIAVLAVAVMGFLMLSGRIELRRGVRVVMGCFLLFGAPTIAQALRAFSESASPIVGQPASATPSIPKNASSPAAVYDPYAGASVPTR